MMSYAGRNYFRLAKPRTLSYRRDSLRNIPRRVARILLIPSRANGVWDGAHKE